MGKWGKRIEFSKAEVDVVLNLGTKELLRQIPHGNVEPDLLNVVKKTTKVREKFAIEEMKALHIEGGQDHV